MFEAIDTAPPDAILGLTEAFKQDPRPGKMNLAVGVYKDAHGRTPVLASVKAAEKRILESESSKGYLPIDGDPAYAGHVQRLLLGDGHAAIEAGRVATSATPGGTGALRVAADYLAAKHPGATVWLSEPTWPNHPGIFQGAGLGVKTYPYFDAEVNGLAAEAMLASLAGASAGDVVVLHGCCHNPTGADPDAALWGRLARLLAERGALPLVDFAYQGFADGLEADAAGLRAVAEACPELLVCSSYSKNFGLYGERVGALSVVAGSAEAAAAVQSHVKACIRRNYSNPPVHGASIVTTILDDAALRSQWETELAEMRGRINAMRSLLAEALDQRGVSLSPRGNGFIAEQRGMFSFSGLTREQVERLRADHAIYIVGSGRINVAGITEQTVDRLAEAVAAVVG